MSFLPGTLGMTLDKIIWSSGQTVSRQNILLHVADACQRLGFA
jgi:hypothetical protein